MAFKMNGWNAGMGTGSAKMGMVGMPVPPNRKASPMTKPDEEKMYGGDKTYSEAEKQSKGQMNEVIKKQKAYEKKKKSENPDWNKRDDNAWKARLNQINKYAGSKKRYDVETGKQDDGGKVKQSTRKGTGDAETVDKTVIKTEEGTKDKDVIKKDAAGNIIETKNVDKDTTGTEKLKKKFGDEGELISVRGYATGEKKEEHKKTKKELKAEAKANRKAAKAKKKADKKKK